MRLVDSIEAVKKYMSSIGKHFPKGSNADKHIEYTAKRLGISRRWLSANLKFEREAPEELKKAVKEETAENLAVIRKYLMNVQPLNNHKKLDSKGRENRQEEAGSIRQIHSWFNDNHHTTTISFIVECL